MDFSNTYIKLGDRFFEKSQPTPVASPKLFLWNHKLAEQLNISPALQKDPEALAQIFSGTRMPTGAQPVATAYAGHQFGHFNPQLGDGRAHLLGEIIDQTGKRCDLQLKGSGRSAFSRSGDGRCAIGPAVREFIMSEAMHALGVPTTRCLAVVTTGEQVYRERPVPGAVVTRVASSHIRVGSFEYFASRGDNDSLKALFDFTIERHYPDIREADSNPIVLLIDKAIEKQIHLVTEWMRVGFIHGVMNTDNTAISGETIDFGPCAMMGIYNPETVYSSIDTGGRYAFGSQPYIAQWNMARFAESLLPLLDQNNKHTIEQIQTLITEFPSRFQQAYIKMMANKMGMITPQADDDTLILSLLKQLGTRKMDYTISFDLLTKSLSSENAKSQISSQLEEHYQQWHERVTNQEASIETISALMRSNNPVVIPRNHHMEAVLKECEELGVTTAAERFLEVLLHPYKETEASKEYQTPPADNDEHYQTFCGT